MSTADGTADTSHPHEVDPLVAELVEAIRDRFGLRGLRDARGLIDQEIVLAEDALAEPLHRPGPLGGGEAGTGRHVEGQLDPAVGGVDRLATRTGGAGEPPPQLAGGHDQPRPHLEVVGHDDEHGGP